MRTFGRMFLILLSILGVGALGYYAYVLAAETLTYPFLGTESQHGDTLEVVLARPRFTLNFQGGPILDEVAIRSSLFFGSAALIENTTLSGAYNLTISGEYIRLHVPTLEQGQSIRLDAKLYNEKKTTSYRIPHDITLVPLEHPRSLSMQKSGIPRDRRYAVSLSGFDEYTPEHIRYFVSYDKNVPCSVNMIGQDFSQIYAKTLNPITRDGQNYETTITFDYRLDTSYICLIGGVNGVYDILENRVLDALALTGSTLETLSPEYDMQTRVEFDFSHAIYEDTGALYSMEYIANRRDAKIDFLKHLSLSPEVPSTADNLILTPDRAILTLPLQEGQESRFSIKGLEDIYGRTEDLQYRITPKQAPFLSLRFQNQRSYYQSNEPVPVKIYALKAPKKTYSLKLCRLPLELYAHGERILSENMTGSSIDTVYDILNGKDAFSCVKKDVDLSGSGYVSNLDIRSFTSDDRVSPGMYILAFANKGDLIGFQKPVSPLLFTVMDSHITMKVDSSGKMMFLVTDMKSGKPLANQEITVMRNISRTYHETWNATTNQADRQYIPLTSQAFATGIILGKTNDQGFLDVSHITLTGGLDSYISSPYELSFENWWQYEGRYDSFIVESRGDGRIGFLVSTWNDGITGYNFGMKASDYSDETRPRYTVYLHGDRKLYLPGEIVHIHGIIRENSTSVKVPENTSFTLVIDDPMGKEVDRVSLKPNEFGTISRDYMLPKDASLGNYSANLTTMDMTEYVANGSMNFQVEVFQNPTFTATVELRSPDIENESVKNLRKKPNTDTNTPWYSDVYEGHFSLQGVVKSTYSNGQIMRNTPFTYRIYRSEHYPENYWSDCFWGCYHEPSLEYYTEGSGMIDRDGYGIFSIPVAYQSFYNDYKYTAEIIVKDPLSGEVVTTPASLIVKLPEEFKSFAPDNPLVFTAKKKILQNGEELQGSFKREYGSWDASLKGKYGFEIVRRDYHDIPVDDIRAGKINITSSIDTVVLSGVLTGSAFSKKLIAYPAGEYLVRSYPLVDSGVTIPDSARSETLFYIAGLTASTQGSSLRVIPEKTVYQPGETARVLVTVPFSNARILLTLEKGGVLQHEYFTLTGSSFTREYKVDDTLIPNAYVGVVAFKTRATGGTRSYAVGYGEIIADYSEKKANLAITVDKPVYKNHETVSVDMTLTDRSGNPLQGEIAMMVVDESLIRILGNIDLDIIPKFYQKFPFTVKTALSAIGIEHNLWLTRKGSNGGSGDKGGAGVEIASRMPFQKTVYYNPSIRTDANGKAKTTFTLPDNTTDYRIITIANTKNAHFAIAEKTIEVRKDYLIESHAPMIMRPGDTSLITASVFNSTNRITGATLSILIGTGANVIKKSIDLTLNPRESLTREFTFSSLSAWSGNVAYRIDLKEKNILLDSLTSSFRYVPIPEIVASSRTVELWNTKDFSYTLPRSASGMDAGSSLVTIALSPSYITELSNMIRSLEAYPYGSIEQMIGSSLPNALALNFSEKGGLDMDHQQAEENVSIGLAKILRMQHYSGGWVSWEGDSNTNTKITPYVLRSLMTFKNLGKMIPDTVFTNGTNYLLSNLTIYQSDPDMLAEVSWTLALLGKKQEATTAWKSLDPKILTRHGLLAYAYTAHILDLSPPNLALQLDRVLLGSGSTDESTYWYWDRYADMGIYAQLLMDRTEDQKAFALIDRLVHAIDLTSDTLSTQAKVQIFRAILQQVQKTDTSLSSPIMIALRGDAIIADASLAPKTNQRKIESSRLKMGDHFTLRRDSAKIPISVTIITRDRTKSIIDMPPENRLGMMINRTFELIDESKGTDQDGHYIFPTRIDDGVFLKGRLYRVTLKAGIPLSDKDKDWYNLAIEDSYPAGWRSLNSNFQTENALTRSTSTDGWSHIESRDDRVLAYVDIGKGNTRTLTYYIRPDIVGSYLLPPARAYFMYQPAVHAITSYQKITVKE